MNDKMKWWVEFGFDVVASYLLGWLLLGALAAAFFKDKGIEGDFASLVPILVRVAVTGFVWKLFRSFNWLKGVPPKLG